LGGEGGGWEEVNVFIITIFFKECWKFSLFKKKPQLFKEFKKKENLLNFD
jgi:hypothetical protein